MADKQLEQPGQEQQQQQQVTGQVMYRRRLSSKLVFYDVLQSGVQWWEVVVKVGTYGSVQDVKDLRDSLKLGDQVEVAGWCTGQQQHPELQAVSIKVTQPWKLQSTGVAFVPQPAPRAQQQRHKQPVPPPSLQQHQQQQSTSGAEGKAHVHAAGAEKQAPADACNASDVNADAMTAATAAAGAADAPAAARVTSPQVAICKFWVNTGRCAKGGECPYLHTLLPAAAGGAPSCRKWLQQRELERQQRSAEAGFVHNSSAAAKRRRASVFAAWLVQQYGKERLNHGAGVLDVAGGSGSLTFELAYVHGIKCTLIDPRPLKLNKLQHKHLQQAGRSAAISTLTMQQLQEGHVTATCTVQHCQQLPQQQLELGQAANSQTNTQQQDDYVQQQSDEDDAEQQELSQDWQEAEQQQQAGAMPPTQQHSPDVQQQAPDRPPLQLWQVQAWFGPDLWGTPGWRQLFSDCSIVVGLHPDQATEPILDLSVQQQLPFAVMPCCVFPRLFAHRRLQQANGVSVPVVTYEQLVGYLVQRGDAQQTVLDFEGANILVYRA